jgi:putative mRNA 3-end processing factor
VISDHADWDELTGTLAELAPGEVWITHGREEALARWCALNGLQARALAIVGYEDEED